MKYRVAFLTKYFSLGFAILLLASCASLSPKFTEPTVTVNSFQVVRSEGLSPAFEIGLHIVNPNSIPLELKGLAYSAKIQGHQILTGVGKNLPIIETYDEGDVTLLARADLLQGFRLITQMMKGNGDPLAYQLTVKLNVGDFVPDIVVTREGIVGQ